MVIIVTGVMKACICTLWWIRTSSTFTYLCYFECMVLQHLHTNILYSVMQKHKVQQWFWLKLCRNCDLFIVHQVESCLGFSGDETSLVDAETSSSSVSSSTTVSTQSSGKTRKPPKVLQISPPTLLVTTSDFSPMSLCSPSLPTASLTPAMLQVSNELILVGN